MQVFSYSPDGWQLTSQVGLCTASSDNWVLTPHSAAHVVTHHPVQWVQEHYGQAALDRWLATNHLGSWAQPDNLLNGTAVSSEDLVSRHV